MSKSQELIEAGSRHRDQTETQLRNGIHNPDRSRWEFDNLNVPVTRNETRDVRHHD